jgi:hypothetical protein
MSQESMKMEAKYLENASNRPRTLWWGRGDLNPGPRTPQARILDQTGPRPLRDAPRPQI